MERRGRSLDWNHDITSNLKDNWICFFQEFFPMETISFKRCIRPPGAIDSHGFVMFSDASEQAFGIYVYVRWKLSNGKFKSRSLAAKEG